MQAICRAARQFCIAQTAPDTTGYICHRPKMNAYPFCTAHQLLCRLRRKSVAAPASTGAPEFFPAEISDLFPEIRLFRMFARCDHFPYFRLCGWTKDPIGMLHKGALKTFRGLPGCFTPNSVYGCGVKTQKCQQMLLLSDGHPLPPFYR